MIVGKKWKVGLGREAQSVLGCQTDSGNLTSMDCKDGVMSLNPGLEYYFYIYYYFLPTSDSNRAIVTY